MNLKGQSIYLRPRVRGGGGEGQESGQGGGAGRHSGRVTQTREYRDIQTREDCEALVRAFYGRALEDPIIGWIFTEVGRQPWIVYETMRTSEAVTSAGGLWFVLAGAIALYAVLGTVSVIALKTIARRAAEEDGDEGGDVPYGPPSTGEPGAVGAR